MKRTLISLSLVVAGVLSGTALWAQADDPEAYGDDYRSGDYGRVRYQENEPTLLRADVTGDPVEPATLNAPLFPGDALRTERVQQAEIQLADGTLIRVAGLTDLTFQSLPESGADFRDNTVLRLDVGTIQVITGNLGDSDEMRIDTRAASVYLLGNGEFRVDVDADGETRVASRRGVAEVVGEGGSVLVRGGTASRVSPGYLPSDAIAFRAYDLDAFDQWCQDRDRSLRSPERYARGGYDDDVDREELPPEVQPYYGELAVHGRWVLLPEYGYSWYPYDVGAGWRPYYDGYWCYGPKGYFWVSNEPWGWAPYHYGRWNWVTGYGWCWTPGRIFAGAWVSWSWGSIHVGWAPLDYWGRPAFVRHVLYGYYDPYCWTFVRYDHFRVRSYRRYAVPANRIGDGLGRHAVVTRAPRVSPLRLAEARDARARAVRLASEDRAARVRPVATDRVPAQRFKDVEDRVLRRGASARRVAATGQGPAADRRRRDEAGPRESRAGGEGSGRATPGRGGTDRQGTERPAVERRAAPESEGRTAPYPRRKLEDPRVRDRTPSRSAKPGSRRSSEGTSERVRDMYERLARPRETQQQDRPEASRSRAVTPERDAVDRNRQRREEASRAGSPRAEPKRSEARGRDSSGGSKERQPSSGRSSSGGKKGDTARPPSKSGSGRREEARRYAPRRTPSRPEVSSGRQSRATTSQRSEVQRSQPRYQTPQRPQVQRSQPRYQTPQRPQVQRSQPRQQAPQRPQVQRSQPRQQAPQRPQVQRSRPSASGGSSSGRQPRSSGKSSSQSGRRSGGKKR